MTRKKQEEKTLHEYKNIQKRFKSATEQKEIHYQIILYGSFNSTGVTKPNEIQRKLLISIINRTLKQQQEVCKTSIKT